VSDPYTPLIIGYWLNVLLWVFSILAIGCTVWYIMYVESSTNRNRKNDIIGLILTALLIAITLQLHLFNANIIL
jgi:hypothetical protein